MKQNSVLLKTSAATDVLVSGNNVAISGLNAIARNSITGIKQFKYRAETVQVLTLTLTAETIVAGVIYQLTQNNVNVRQQGYTQNQYQYGHLATAAEIAVSQANARAAICTAIAAQINGNTNFSYCTAVAVADAVTITDNAGYYPPRLQNANDNRKGATTLAYTGGFTSATTLVTTTAAIYQFGDGTWLSQNAVIFSPFFQNSISGDFDTPMTAWNGSAAPTAATAGQFYDAWAIQSAILGAPSGTSMMDQLAIQKQTQVIFVDNGTGASTTNAAGFLAFEREMQRLQFGLYLTNPSAIVDFFDSALIASATYPTTGAAITTTDNVVMAVQGSQGGNWYVNPIGTHTLLTPIVGTGGMQPYLDVTTQEGVEVSTPNLTQCPKEFVVGKTAMSFYVKMNIGTGVGTTDFKTLSFGFRKKAAYAVDQTAYEAASVATAALGVPLDTGVAPVFNIITGPGTAGAITNTSTVVTPAVSTTHDLLVTVDINGVAHFYVDGVDKTPLLAAAYTFTAGLHLMPFISFRHGAGAAATPKVIQCAAIPTDQWRI